ncbi:hypothetical protein OXPF_42600 [Oxobacter pfennigii]|uniref:Uncharacterized protein n=1 Tax=Oxobacter pfennigii TaxID=36849 RepID=A0A0P8Y7K6_9CLOT|nr:hypothetical protein [Oxobacter pfennigii]KPU42475.1 hypothetical protein OXPF_42600 [Oxobacter pfennigii]
MDWIKESKYYIVWEKYEDQHPELFERNKSAMKDRFESYQDMMFDFLMSLLF